MKRVGYLFDQVVEPQNLRLAFYKAQKGKSGKNAVERFRENLDEQLCEIRNAFLSGDFKLGNYTCFPVFDPKERLICAAAFRERVMQHAVMNVCEPLFEVRQIYDSYACRKGKGLDSCLQRTVIFCRRHGWHLKMDVHKYFDSIPHDRLKALMRRYFKDGFLLAFFDAIIDSYHTASGRGIPIGNLTSQFFANAYLAELDHHIKERLRVSGYVRYMDDFVLFADSRSEVKRLRGEVVRFCRDELGLEMNEPRINTSNAGLRFLGYVIRSDSVRLSLRAKRRFRKKLAIADSEENQSRAQALVAFTERADAVGFRRKTIFGSSVEGAYRVNRGGSWNNNARNCRPANRDRNSPGIRNNNLGFRVALAPSSGTRRMPFGEQADGPVTLQKGDETNRLHGLVDGADASVERPAGSPLEES
jgi:retron-type reverse transcriptase